MANHLRGALGGGGSRGTPNPPPDDEVVPPSKLEVAAGVVVVVVFFGRPGIEIENVTGAKVFGNIIGLDATGTVAIGNTQAGVFLDNASNNEIGGPTAAHRNIISGNLANFAAGVWLNLAGATGNKIQGNYIGTDITGSAALPNIGVRRQRL